MTPLYEICGCAFIAMILDTFMYWHYMLFNIVFMCKFVVTLSTLILGTFVYWYFFKQRYWAHNGSFTHEDRRKYTTLSEHIWDIHDQQLNYNINLKIIEKTSGFNPITLQCKICLSEIVNILNPTLNPNQYSLNKCHKTFTLCRHLKKKNICYLKPNSITLKVALSFWSLPDESFCQKILITN